MMALPGVYEKIRDGGLGIVPPAASGLFAVVGPARSGTVNKLVYLSDPASAKDEFSEGLLVEHLQDAFACGASQVVAVRTGESVLAAISPITHTGTGTAATSAGGTPRNTRDFVIEITEDGTVNLDGTVSGGKYRLSKNGGRTFEAEQPFPANGQVDLGNGVSVTFGPVDATTPGTLVKGDTYSLSTTEAMPTTQEVLDAVSAVLDGEPEVRFVVVVPATDSAVWASLDGLASENFTSKHTPVFMLATRGLDTEDPSTFTDNAQTDMNAFSSVWLAVVASWAWVPDTFSGMWKRSAVGCIAGAIARREPHESIGWVRYGVLPRVLEPVPALTDTQLQQLEESGHSLLRVWPGYGAAPVSGRTAAPGTSDFKFLEVRRIVNEAVRAVRAAAVPFVNAPGDEAGL
ncbi:MAG: DUF2586 family protein, partial [Candidatus Hydrothermae bacterium]|nr:DUF2586 family protein [Candidatus Hydrothermae bacterium]